MATYRSLFVAFAAILLAAAAPARGEDITLVENGKTNYVIVVCKDASPSEQWAAKELAATLKKMSGAELPILKAGLDPAPARCIHVGLPGKVARLPSPAGDAKGKVPGEDTPDSYVFGSAADANLGPDGFLIDTMGPTIIIAGGKTRGTMYGVFAFLESLGCRWWTPTESTIPTLKTIKVPPSDIRQVPQFEYRDMMYLDIFPRRVGDDPNKRDRSPQVWAARNRVNGMAWDDAPDYLGGRYKVSGNLVHSYLTLLKDASVEMKDEMYALRDGKRAVGQQPCLSNADVLAGTIKAVVAKLKSDPKLEFVVVGQMDNTSFCTCEKCAAIDKEEDSHAGQVIRFANQVAEAAEKQVPGAKIATAAYEWSRKPPKSLKPRANVYITLCSIECDFAHPLAAASNPENKAFKEDIEGWAKIAPKIIIWHYCGNRDHYLMPNPDLESFAPNSKFFADNKVAGVFVQGTHVGRMTEFVPLRMWLWSKVLWEPKADGNALIKEFCKGYYGPAADGVLKYIEAIHSVGHDANRMFHLGRRGWLNEPFLAPDVMAEAAAAAWDAQGLLIQPEYPDGMTEGDLQRRVRHVKMPVTYVLFKRGPQSKTWQAVEEKAGKLNPGALADEFAKTIDENKINYLADPEDVKPFVEWMKDYAALIAAGPGKDLPPELAKADPNTYRLIHAVQMDRGAKWWVRAEGASDGWACRIPSAGWSVRHFFSPYDDFTPGKTYQLFIRVKADKVLKDGKAFECGVYPAPRVDVKVDASDLKDGKWHVIPAGKPTVWKDSGGGLYIPLTRDGAVDAIYLDCLWLEEVK